MTVPLVETQKVEGETSPAVVALDPPTPIKTTPHGLLLEYIRRGWNPVKVPFKEKNPNRKNWQALPKVTLENVESNFGGASEQGYLSCNIGVQFGPMSNYLVDADLDCPEALLLAGSFFPPTGAFFGRASKQNSHFIYYSRELVEAIDGAGKQFKDPEKTEGAMLLELRVGGGGKGSQTVFPGSVHSSGENVEWSEFGEPSTVTAEQLLWSAKWTAAACLMVRAFPESGAKHDAALVIGGFLARLGWTAAHAEFFLQTVLAAAGADVVAARCAAPAVEKWQSGDQKLPGFPRLAEVFGDKRAKSIAKWLGYGAAKEAKGEGGKTGGKRKDNYRQKRAEREIVKFKREGLDYEEIKARLLDSDDQGVVDWVNERGLRDDERELKEHFEKVRGGAHGSNKPEIFWSGETVDEACIEAEEALVGLGTLYERMGIIVSVGRGRGRDRDGNIICFPMLKERGDYALKRDLARCVQFTEEDKMTGAIVSIAPPMDVVRMIKSEGQTGLPVIAAMIHTPTLFSDGSILQKPGFDEKSGFLFDPKGVTFLPVMERPTKDDAKKALETILHVLREFPFERKKGEPSPSRSVALAFILLAPVRQSFLFAPGTAFDAPAPRTGKGKLANIAHAIAYGHRAVVDNWTKNAEENEKMLGAILLKGVGALAIDNIERTLGGGLISKVLTEEKISVRILGKSELPNCEPCLLTSFTGNNLKFEKDITARVLKCRLDAGMENPEEREFDWDPVDYALAHRPELVQAVLTILRAYFVHCENGGERPKCSAFGDYKQWSRIIREPLLWLDQPDPVLTNKEVKDEDPERERTLTVFQALHDAFPDGEPRLVKDIVKETTLADRTELRAALLSVASSKNHENVDSGRLGGWFGAKMDNQVSGMTLRKEGIRRPVAWYIESAQADAHIRDFRTYEKEEKMRGATSRYAPCQGKGTLYPDLKTMPIGGKPIETDFASDPFKI